MEYYTDMVNPKGFNFGDHIPFDIEERRAVYIYMINIHAAEQRSNFRAVPSNGRMGDRHDFQIVFVSLLVLRMVSVVEPYHEYYGTVDHDFTVDPDQVDDEMKSAIRLARMDNPDQYVLSDGSISPKFQKLMWSV